MCPVEAEFILGNYLMCFLPTALTVHTNKDNESDLDTGMIPGINSSLPKSWNNLAKKDITQHIWHARRGELESIYFATYKG